MSERFVITNHMCEVTVLDTQNPDLEDGETALLFGFDIGGEDSEYVAKYLERELEPIVRILNEQCNIVEDISQGVAEYLESRFGHDYEISIETIDKECYEALADIKGDVMDRVIEILKEKKMSVGDW